MTSGRYDVVVVGAGIVGLAIARRLLVERPDLSLLTGAFLLCDGGHSMVGA